MYLNVVYDEIHKLHFDPTGRHPENPWRLDLAISALKDSKIWELIKLNSTPEGDPEILKLIHSKDYIDYIKNECVKGFHRIDSDTYVNEYTFDISTRFITATYMATLNSIEFGGLWLIMPRPGGHHAGRSGWAMGAPTLGFCIFNYAAIAAKTLLDRGFKVLMVDFDAHHGNGTQDIFWIEPRVIHIDIHEWGIYPGTGYVDDIGGGGAEGTKINIPLPHYAGDPEYIWIVENVIQPLIEVFKPNGIVVSAGFDSYVGDRLTTLSATDETYEAIAQIFIDAMKIGGVKTIITILEGGYGEGLKMGLTAYVETLIQIRKFIKRSKPNPPSRNITQKLQGILKEYWNIDKQFQY